MLRSILAVILTVALPASVRADTPIARVIDDARLILPDNPQLGFNAPAGAIDVDALRVSSGSGSIKLIFDDELETMVVTASVRSESEERARDAGLCLVHNENTSLMVIAIDWPTQEGNDRVDIEVTMPGVDTVAADSTNGAISVIGGSGVLTLESNNGGIGVKDFEGTVSARAKNGGIGLQGTLHDVVAESANGGIAITLTDDAVGPVNAETRNGALALTVGSSFKGALDLETRNGGIKTMASGVRVEQTGRRAYTMTFSDDGRPSSLTTRNGGIAVVSSKNESTEL